MNLGPRPFLSEKEPEPMDVPDVLAVTDHIASPLSRPGQLLYSVEEAASLLGIGRTFMFSLLATGEIDSLKIGRRRKIPRDAIESYIDRLRAQQGATTKEPGDLPLPGQRDRQRK
jgi:excisionase family DNA binding protein